jgi:hypothetical protein
MNRARLADRDTYNDFEWATKTALDERTDRRVPLVAAAIGSLGVGVIAAIFVAVFSRAFGAEVAASGVGVALAVGALCGAAALRRRRIDRADEQRIRAATAAAKRAAALDDAAQMAATVLSRPALKARTPEPFRNRLAS